MNITDEALDTMAKAAFEFDWPKDTWERLGPGYHQDRYKGMVRAALAAAPASAPEPEPWWIAELRKHWGEGESTVDTRRAALIALQQLGAEPFTSDNG